MTRRRALLVARVGFVVVALASAWWGFRGRGGEVADALAATGVVRVAVAVLLVVPGLALTAVVWRSLLRWSGEAVGRTDAAEVFLVGQLGKYVPGSVWSLAAQAHLGRRHRVPARASLAASSTFLLVHTATGLLVGGGGLLAIAAAGPEPGASRPALALAAAVGAAALAPPVLRRVAGRLAGRPVRLGGRQVAGLATLMLAAWCCYGASLLALAAPGTSRVGPATAVAAFALAHAVGVVVVVAPAGLGAREGVLVALLAPVLGGPQAAAVALLSRVVHVLADVLAAGLAVLLVRAVRSFRVVRSGERRVVPREPDQPDRSEPGVRAWGR